MYIGSVSGKFIDVDPARYFLSRHLIIGCCDESIDSNSLYRGVATFGSLKILPTFAEKNCET